MLTPQPLKQIIRNTQHLWDVPGTRPAVRNNFTKALVCRTTGLGAEVYASKAETKVVPHTCKSRACTSCGHRATVLWQREQWAALPEIPYKGITLTMPDVLWDFFQDRRLLADLPALAAGVIQQWAHTEHRAQILLIVVPHTFSRRLTFMPHLHILASAGGFDEARATWISNLNLNKSILMQRWRLAVTTYLRVAYKAGLLRTNKTASQIEILLDMQEERWWSVDIANFKSRARFLNYAGRYVRRPPIAEYKITEVTSERIRFRMHDHRLNREVEIAYSPDQFIRNLAIHVHDHYTHGVRYFGLLAPLSKGRLFSALFAILGQTRRPRPQRLSWALSIKREFGADPLLGTDGHRMKWAGRLQKHADGDL